MDESEKQKRKDQKARIRRARNAQRKLKKARTELEALGEITDWEEEFIASVDERLEKYDSAFADPSLGGFAQALSTRQMQVLAQMRRKIKDKKKPATIDADDDDPGKPKWRSSFKSKHKSSFNPRVRNIEDEMFGEQEAEQPTPPPKPKKPFLKIIDGGKN
ncbi:MAG: hypothetical protein L3J65_09585 [Robiginitomaculum sp.]|nr:hypothetical protein [Robiginitomaculum sp.]